MNTIKFVIDKKQFQKSSFKKYLFELKHNEKLLTGGKCLLSAFIFILFLNLLIENHVFNVFSIIVIILFLSFLFLMVKGVYATWKEGATDYEELFKNQNELCFHYTLKYYIYTDDVNNKLENRTSWEEVRCAYHLKKLDVLIIENINLGTYYLHLKERDIYMIIELLKDKNILLHNI